MVSGMPFLQYVIHDLAVQSISYLGYFDAPRLLALAAHIGSFLLAVVLVLTRMRDVDIPPTFRTSLSPSWRGWELLAKCISILPIRQLLRHARPCHLE
jgi:hypothetical protein